MIYQKAGDVRGEHLFYALSSEILEDENISNYSNKLLTQERLEKYLNNSSKMIWYRNEVPKLCHNSKKIVTSYPYVPTLAG